ncbi:MAG: hypothetical protein CL878_02740 [Dehalococcoidia bacterium]|nr:hypothetical protein [Dehalococcoidia bacterium]
MAGYRTADAAYLEQFAHAIFASAGTPDDIATHVARHLVRANLSGHDSHGVLRIPQYVQFIDDGMIRPAAQPKVMLEHGATALVGAQRGFGQYSTSVALELAIRKAEEFGVGLVTVRQGNHIGRVGEYTEEAARRGFVAQVFGGTAGANVRPAAPFGAAGAALGTNPFSVGVPTSGSDPVLIDFATTVLAEGKLRIYRVKQEELPPDVIVDRDGDPSVDVEDFYSRGGMLKPIAAHKGSGLSLATALLGGLAAIGEADPSSNGTAPQPPTEGGRDRTAGIFLLVISPGAFGDADVYRDTVSRTVRAIKAAPTAPGVEEVLVPGEPEFRSREDRQKDGIALPDGTWDELGAVAQRFGLDMPPTRPS